MNINKKPTWYKIVALLGMIFVLLTLVGCARLFFIYVAGQETITAANDGDFPKVKRLVAAGADVNDGDADLGTTALALASNRGYANIVQYLLSKGANVSTVDNSGKTALIMAASNGHVDAMKILLAHGIDINAQDRSGRTALMDAVYNGRAEAVQLLLSYKANVNMRDNEGKTALGIALYFDSSRAVITRMLKRFYAKE